MNRFKNFSESGSKAITAAVNIAGKMGHITVGTEHLLMGILTSGKSDAADLLAEYDINFACVYNVALNVLGCGQITKLTEDDFSTNAVAALKNAWNTAIAGGKTSAGINEILCSIVTMSNCMAYQIISTLTKNNPDFYTKAQSLCLRKNMAAFTSVDRQSKKELKNLEKYSRNLTAIAKLTPFDPCIGREKEIRQLVEILLRRRKNNPCLVGLAGVGKTAIVEGLANMIVDGNVPDEIKSKTIYAIDMAWVLAGTKYRGDFEERIKTIMEEAASDKDVILFIDEIHTIVSAGGAEGAIDAANIMKPALARGKVQVIGATTRDEYARTIEKDAALERRFCPVDIQEPSIQ
ncbi:MAG: ATP-dependent Clp protease ATP-binding subunit [Oscillospiraceae bacterium]|nr:ATP-dependent Clp protease ATP-binding subunit [Oscillospiraceae bacterium]